MVRDNLISQIVETTIHSLVMMYRHLPGYILEMFYWTIEQRIRNECCFAIYHAYYDHLASFTQPGNGSTKFTEAAILAAAKKSGFAKSVPKNVTIHKHVAAVFVPSHQERAQPTVIDLRHSDSEEEVSDITVTVTISGRH